MNALLVLLIVANLQGETWLVVNKESLFCVFFALLLLT